MATPLDEATPHGYGRYPYLFTHLFRYLGLFPLVRRADLEVYFNPAERGEETSVEDLVKHWRRSGVRTIYAAAWQEFPEWTYDYGRLIELAHNNAMLVYAWYELPYVSEKFWLDHPEWRERNALDEEAAPGWHKPMALADPECLTAVKDQMRRQLTADGWDGVVLNRVGWESNAGPADPASYTPFHPSAREAFQAEADFDPLELFDPQSNRYWESHPDDLARFEAWRTTSARSALGSILAMLAELRRGGQPDLEIILTHDGRRAHTGLSTDDLFDLRRIMPLKLQYAAPLAEQWAEPPEDYDLVQLMIAPTPGREGFMPEAPTAYPTGLAFYHQLGRLIADHRRFSIYSESALYEVDTQLLPFLNGTTGRGLWTGEELVVNATRSGEIVFAQLKDKDLVLDGQPAASFHLSRLLLPIGPHQIRIRGTSNGNGMTRLRAQARVVDLTGDLLRSSVTPRGLTVQYRSPRRAHLVLSRAPRSLRLDGRRLDVEAIEGLRGWTVALPSGIHNVQVTTRGPTELALVWASLLLSNAIVLVSLISIAALGTIFIAVVWRSKRRRSTGEVHGLQPSRH
jgi:hypothetical protein